MRAQALFDPGGARTVVSPMASAVASAAEESAALASAASASVASAASAVVPSAAVPSPVVEERATAREPAESVRTEGAREADQESLESQGGPDGPDGPDGPGLRDERLGPSSGTGGEPGRLGRLRLAVRERLPLWLQLRCGLERRSLIALAVVLVVAVAFAVQHFWTGEPRSVRAPETVGEAAVPDPSPGPHMGQADSGGSGGADGGGASGASGAAGASGVPGNRIVVDVSGKVRSPGIHRLPAGARVADALRAAGGVRPGADISGLNRARLLMDGEQVTVGLPGGPGMPGPASSAGTGAGASGAAGAGLAAGPVSLNTATADQLDTLPGVGPVLAQHIIDYRTQHGGFRSVDQLREVNGIGERRFADLKNAVRP